MGEVAPSGDGDGAAMRRAVRRLSLGAATEDERAEAATEVGRLARSNERIKRALPELGVVLPLVSMLADGGAGAGARTAAAQALLELARGTHRNKVHIVKAGLLKKLPKLMDLSTSQDLALLLLSVSSLANTDFPLSSADLLPFLVATLTATDVPDDTRLACLAALRNLSAKLEHVRAVVTSGAVRALLLPSLLEHTETIAEAALGVLADVAAASAAGRREMAEDEEAPRALVEAMARHEGAGCQEHATYLVMALAHGGGGGRALRWRMRQLGAVQALLEVSLLGSPLARSRAAKILQWFKDDGQDRIRAHSGPRMEAVPSRPCNGKGGGADGTKACRSAVDRIVKQSLDMNMRSIMRRATASVDMTNAKQLVASSSSKSLPC
ncbi:U-box domain-containing protein 7 [Hordeum vulgare]|uniref:Predicted protein n=1 Tax=Hordeum vulgare subsp. vulgare TaxID=112509 RepID=F2E0K3_HORVV|nr:uncharacterized protein LOC123451234 [Hordeum vulgare subsp. vulgare]KAE8807558.1 U-box domain-containing protein 7 [Hordeum vulgare]BAK00875.1 predicted protein [Hordeum vulgare subsp. vulgare]